ncbi:unnamed protein product [Enterobius vermicularis]|uniref:Transmembrane protein 208 n=1 Tax=Enterobius vermicularis TaxID=51028 RepID=A0A0N4UX43_ENTVE|nr:unnamed protein product [Enterobius vermicularis]
MNSMARCRRNEKGQVVDAGLDLNQPEAFGEYCKDVIILSSFVLILSLLWSPFFLFLLLIPAYAFYKFWTGLLAPWIFARTDEEFEDDKKNRKRDRKLRRT